MKLRAFCRLIGRRYIQPERSGWDGDHFSSGVTQHFEGGDMVFGVMPLWWSKEIAVVFIFRPMDKRYKTRKLAIELELE